MAEVVRVGRLTCAGRRKPGWPPRTGVSSHPACRWEAHASDRRLLRQTGVLRCRLQRRGALGRHAVDVGTHRVVLLVMVVHGAAGALPQEPDRGVVVAVLAVVAWQALGQPRPEDSVTRVASGAAPRRTNPRQCPGKVTSGREPVRVRRRAGLRGGAAAWRRRRARGWAAGGSALAARSAARREPGPARDRSEDRRRR
jgi:hypothetical protein